MRRYNGNTGRYEYIPDSVSPQTSRYRHGTGGGTPSGNGGASKSVRDTNSASRRKPQHQSAACAGDDRRSVCRQPQPSGDVLGSLQKTLGNLFSQGFENEDLLLFAVLFLMYQETHDKELLIIMGGMFLL